MASNAPEVSVIIASYNVADYIARAVNSALGQRHVSVEVIVADDASNDHTRAVLGRLTDPRLHTLHLPENQGPSAARNAALAMAGGEWVAIVDGDDTMEPDRLHRCLERARAKQADIVVDNLLRFDERSGVALPMFADTTMAMDTLSLARLIEGNASFLGDGEALGYMKPVIRRAFMTRHNLRYDPSIRIGEDYALLFEALACGAHCVVEPHAGYRYTVRQGSISQRLTLADIARIRAVDEALLARYPLDPQAQTAQRRRDAGLQHAEVFTLAVNGIKQRDLAGFVAAVRADPSVLLRLGRMAAERLVRLAP